MGSASSVTRASSRSRSVDGSSPVRSVAGRDQQLLGEEGVAARPGVDRFDEVGVEVAARDRPELLRRLAPVERDDLQALDAARAIELGEERQERVAPVELVGPVGQHERHADVAQVPDEEADQVACRPVGPVEVLDDEDHRRHRRESVEDGRAAARTGGPAPSSSSRPDRVLVRGRAEVGDEAGEVGAAVADDGLELLGREATDQSAKRLDDGGVGQRAVTEDDAAAAEDHRPVAVREVGELADEPGLADAGLARDHDRAAPPLAGAPQRGSESLELDGPSDEDRAGDAGRHALDYHAPQRPWTAVVPVVAATGSRPVSRWNADENRARIDGDNARWSSRDAMPRTNRPCSASASSWCIRVSAAIPMP